MKELDRRLKVMDQVIRHMVVRVDEEKKVVEPDATQAADRVRAPARQARLAAAAAARARAARQELDDTGRRSISTEWRFSHAIRTRTLGRRRSADAAGARRQEARRQGKGQRRTLFRRRKVCKFCADKIDDINYKDVKLIGPFVPERGKILPRRISGTCAMHQRKLQTAIKRARQLALIPYVTELRTNMDVILARTRRQPRTPRRGREGRRRLRPQLPAAARSWRCSPPRATRSRSSASA